MKIVMRDGLEFEGTPVEIVRAMQGMAFGAEGQSLSEYIDGVAACAKKFEDVVLNVAGPDEAVKAEALVRAMLDARFCREE